MMIDVTDASFETDVVAESMNRPVVVDLWAPWCGPCRTLGPLIEKVVNETDGKVLLAKINVDENQAASQAFRVQSIPAVYALKDGQIVDGFMGAQPEAEIRAFVEKLLPSAQESRLEELLEAGDETSLIEALDLQPDHPEAIASLAMLLIEANRGEEALSYLARIPETDELRRLGALARTSASKLDSETDELETKLEGLLDRVATDDEARAEFVDLLDVLGSANPTAMEWRRRLSAKLF